MGDIGHDGDFNRDAEGAVLGESVGSYLEDKELGAAFFDFFDAPIEG